MASFARFSLLSHDPVSNTLARAGDGHFFRTPKVGGSGTAFPLAFFPCARSLCSPV
jgi:hypothetical protein